MNNNNNNNNNYNIDSKKCKANNIHYINYVLYHHVNNKLNIDINDYNLYNITPDGNCCMRALSKFISKTEHEHIKVRNEIADFLKDNINIFEDVPSLLNMEIRL